MLEKLTIEVCGIPRDTATSPYDDPRYSQFSIPFATFLDDPLGERDDHQLADMARQVMAVQDRQVRPRLQRWLQRQSNVALNTQQLENYALRLEFAIMLEVLSDSLNSLIREWRQVEVVLGLEGSGSASSIARLKIMPRCSQMLPWGIFWASSIFDRAMLPRDLENYASSAAWA